MVFDKIGKAIGKGARAVGGGGLEVIKWPDHLDPTTYVAWKYPKDVIRAGSTLVVNESQLAIFIRDGKLLGILRPGRHILDTQNVPFLQGLVEGLYGESIFRSNIIFVNLLQYQGTYGDRAFIDWIGVHLLFNGEYFFTVDENRIETFYVRVMGVKSEITAKEVVKRINSFITSTIIDSFGEYASQQAQSGRIVQNVSDFLAMVSEFSEYVKASIGQKVNEMFGIKINEIMLRIDISDRDKELLQLSGPRAFAAMYQRDWIGRERIAESLAKSQGSAGVVAPFMMWPWMTYPPQPPQQPPQPPMTPPAKPQPGQGQPPQVPYPYQPQPYPYPYQPYPPQQWPQARPPQAPQQGQAPYPYQPQPYQQPQAPGQPYPAQPAPGQVQQPPAAAAPAAKAVCPYCGREIPPFSPVCPYCANAIKWCPDGRAIRADQNC